jgi:hypothetical protein
MWRIKAEKSSQTYNDRDFKMGLRKWIRAGSKSWPDDEGAMQGCPEARDMSMPPQGAFLPNDTEPVGVVLVWQDGALGDHGHPISPTIQALLHSMSASESIKQNTYVP